MDDYRKGKHMADLAWAPALAACDSILNKDADVPVWFTSDANNMLYDTLWKLSCRITVQLGANMVSNPDLDTHPTAIRKILRDI